MPEDCFEELNDYFAMPNKLMTPKEASEQLLSSINQFAAEHSVDARDVAVIWGYSIGAPLDTKDVKEALKRVSENFK